jgi:O-antigen/teichoic acid export membrane protein
MHPILKRVLNQRELLVQMLISICVRVLGALSVFLLSLVVGRQLGADDAGYFFLAFSIITFLAAFSRLGFDNTLVRFVGAGLSENAWGDIRFVVSKALSLVVITSTVVAGLLYLGSDFIASYLFNKPLLAPVLQSISPGVIGLSLFTLLAMTLQGLHKVAPSVFIVNISVNILVILAIYFGGANTSSQVGLAWAVSSFITLALGLVFWFKFRKPNTSALTVNWSVLMASAMPLWVVLLMGQLTQWSGQFIAGAYVSTDQVAQLAVAQRTAMLTSFILMAVNLVVAPRFAALYKQNDMQGLQRLALISVKLMVLFAVPIVALMMIFPTFLMGLFGDGFSSGAHLLQILAVGQFINVVTGSVGFLLSMSGHEKDLRNTVLISGPLAIGLAFLLTPWLGATGSAIATAASVATQNLVAVFWVKKRLGFNTLAVWKRT